MPKTRAPYPAEFRTRAVEMVRTSGKTIQALAGDLGVSDQTLRNWLRQADADAGRGRKGDLTSAVTLINTNISAAWQDDTVEIYSGTNDRAGAYQTGDDQINVNSGGLTNSNFGPDHSDLPSTGAQETDKETTNGYITWLEMPWSDLRMTPEKGLQVGVTVAVDFPDSSASTRVGQTLWVGTNANSSNDSAWGTAPLS